MYIAAYHRRLLALAGIDTPVFLMKRGTYIYTMKAIVVKPKNNAEYKFINDLLQKLGMGSTAITSGELEDIGMAKLLRKADKTQKVSRSEIIKKLSA
jgi:hypothetical protein